MSDTEDTDASTPPDDRDGTVNAVPPGTGRHTTDRIPSDDGPTGSGTRSSSSETTPLVTTTRAPGTARSGEGR